MPWTWKPAACDGLAASAEVRTGIVLGQHGSDRPLAFFGDIIANLYAVDARSGELVWKIKADDHPAPP